MMFESACTEFLSSASSLYEVPNCGVRVLAARPLRTREHGTFEFFDDYAPDSILIRVWMRTAVRTEVTSFGTFLSTRCHEFWHHLDFQKFGFSDSWHTQGFYKRAGRECRFRLTAPRLLLDDGDVWMLNASLTRLSSYRKCLKRRILGHSARATSLPPIEDMTRCLRIALGSGCGSILASAADMSLPNSD
jgi:hypothetical protein